MVFWVGLIILALASVALFAIVWYNAVMIQLKPAVEYQVPFIVGTVVFIFSPRRLVRGSVAKHFSS